MQVSEVLENARQRPLGPDEAELLLTADGLEVTDYRELFNAAFQVRKEHKGGEFALDGFVGTVMDCTVDPPCHYCARSTGRDFPAPIEPERIEEATRYIEGTGSRTVEIGAGTNPERADVIVQCARLAAESSGLRVWVNAGPSFSPSHLAELKEAGVEEVGASLETINPELFGRVKPGDDLKKRKELARQIKSAGLKLMSVMMVGLGSEPEDYVDHLFWLKDRDVDHFAVTGFRPLPGAALEDRAPASSLAVARVVAVARLVLRKPDISTGGIMNDPRLLPLQIMAGANRVIHLGAHVHRRRPGSSFGRWGAADEKVVDGLVFSNLRPISEGIIREMGLKPA